MNKEDIYFLISIQDLEQPDFDNACLERECNRLNNIIDELEKYIQEYSYYSSEKDYEIIDTHDLLDKLKELKEGKE